MCNQRDVFTLSSWLQLFNKSQKSYDENVGYGTYQLLYWYQSAGEAVPHQMDLAEQARSSMTSWLQLSNAGQGLGITGRTGGHTVSVCGKFLQSFLYICLQLRFRIGLRDLARGSERGAAKMAQTTWWNQLFSWAGTSILGVFLKSDGKQECV